MPRKQRRRSDARAQRLERQQRPQLLFDRAQSRHGFVDRAQIGPVRLIERRQRPGLRRSHVSCRFDHAFFSVKRRP